MDTTYDEKELLARISEGDEHAFSRLFVEYSKVLHPFIISIVKDEELSKEVIQRIFLKLWLKRDQLPGIEHPRTYIHRMASNECFDHFRKRSAEGKLAAQMTYQLEGETDNNTDSHMNVREILRLVQDAVLKLPPQQQRIYQLSRKQQLKIPEIAAHLNLSHTTVKNSLVKSLKFIRQQLEKDGFYLPLTLILMIS